MFGVLDTTQLYFTSFFFNNFLPGALGADVYKVYYLRKDLRPVTGSVAMVLVERMPGLLAALGIGLIYGLFHWSRIAEALRESLSWSEIPAWEVGAAGAIIVFTAASVLWFRESTRSWTLSRIRGLVTGLLAHKKRVVFEATGWSLLAHGARIAGFYLLIAGVNDRILWGDLLVILPLVAVISALPISPGALGVRESAVAAGLTVFGVLPLNTLAIALLFRIVTWSKSLLGGVLLLRDMFQKK